MNTMVKVIAAGLIATSMSVQIAVAERVVRIAVPVGPATNLIGDLHLPESSPPHPAVVFVHGSENVPRAQEFEIIGAERLVAAGFAVLVVDKRGVGDTPGTYEEGYDLTEMARDVLAQVRFLKARPEIKEDAVGLFGVSRGGWAAPIAAALERECPKGECRGATHDIAFVVTISGPGVSPNETNIYQRGQEILARGVSPGDVERISAYRRVLWNYYGGAGRFEDAVKAAESVATLTDLLEPYEKKPYPPQVLRERAQAFDYFRLGLYDPKPTLTRLDLPILALYGASDRMIPVEESVRVVTQALRGRTASRVVVIPAAGHGMRRQPQPGLPANTSGAVPPFATGYWETLIPWLQERAGR